MRVFSQFLTSGEHERLMASIERERELRHRLSELLRYRSFGLTTQEDVIHYEQHVTYERQQQLGQNKSVSSKVLVFFNFTSVIHFHFKCVNTDMELFLNYL